MLFNREVLIQRQVAAKLLLHGADGRKEGQLKGPCNSLGRFYSFFGKTHVPGNREIAITVVKIFLNNKEHHLLCPCNTLIYTLPLLCFRCMHICCNHSCARSRLILQTTECLFRVKSYT